MLAERIAYVRIERTIERTDGIEFLTRTKCMLQREFEQVVRHARRAVVFFDEEMTNCRNQCGAFACYIAKPFARSSEISVRMGVEGGIDSDESDKTFAVLQHPETGRGRTRVVSWDIDEVGAAKDLRTVVFKIPSV